MKKLTNSKIIRGISALLMTLALCMTMVVPAFALNKAEKGVITVTGAEPGLNLNVSAYRLMDVKLDANGNPQDPVYKWVAGVQGWIDTNYPEYTDANSFSKTAVNDETAKVFYDKLAAAIKSGVITLDATDTKQTDAAGSATLEGEMGNYLILVENGMKIYSPSAVNLVPEWDKDKWVMTTPATVELKSTEPTIVKEITKKENEKTDYQYSIGEQVPYKITADVPHYPANKTINPIFKISDTLSEGLTFDNNLEVKAIVGGKEVTLTKDIDYTVSHPDGKTFEITFVYDEVSTAEKVIVEYSATVNENAVVGEAANPNKATLEYSNNPYFVPTQEEPNQPTKEKEDLEKVYTYGIKVTKVEKGTTTVLPGAEFELRKGTDSNAPVLKFTKVGSEYVVDPKGSVTTLVTDNTGKLNIRGLDVGDYLLTETKAPEGFVLPENATIAVQITDADVNGKVENKNNVEQADGYAQFTVENGKNIELPVTGGMGTVLFTAGGILLIGCAFVLLLIARKKKDMAA